MKKHTEGPWDVGAIIENGFDPIHHRVMGHDGVKIVAKCYYGENDEEREANAHLIAAAPELLEALQYLLSSYKADFKLITGSPLNNTEAVKRATNAINKAKGL